MNTGTIQTFYPASRKKWRQWLQKYHGKQESVWLVCYKKKCSKPTISWGDAVDEALCFGWIDSIRKSLDDETFIQFFSRRKPNSAWSKINKEKVERLVKEGLITQAGYASIETAKQNGSWIILDEVEELTMPKDLKKELKARKGAEAFFQSLSRSVKKSMLQWVAFAKRPETRQKRIDEIATMAVLGLKPKQF